jgi:hypothetical protein
MTLLSGWHIGATPSSTNCTALQTRKEPVCPKAVATGGGSVVVVVSVPLLSGNAVGAVSELGAPEMVVRAPFMVVIVGVIVCATDEASTVTQSGSGLVDEGDWRGRRSSFMADVNTRW